MRQYCFSFSSNSRNQKVINYYPDDFPFALVKKEAQDYFDDFCEDSAYLSGAVDDYDSYVSKNCFYSIDDMTQDY